MDPLCFYAGAISYDGKNADVDHTGIYAYVDHTGIYAYVSSGKIKE
jgi:hypothetical protein